MWGKHLKCCKDRTAVETDWDLKYKVYTATIKTPLRLSGPATVGVVLGSVGLVMCLLHYGGKARERAHQTAMMREHEAGDDYDEIMTPLKGTDEKQRPTPLQRSIGPANIEVSLHEGAEIFRKRDDEVLYEGDMY